MLSKVKIKNYKSINEITVDLSYAEGKAPNGYMESNELPFIEPTSNIKDRKVPLLAIYGANASGKSNFIEGLFTFYLIVTKNFDESYYKPNKLNCPVNPNISMEVEFFADKINMLYEISYSNRGIINEKFTADKKVIYEIKNNNLSVNIDLCTNLYTKKTFEEIYKVSCLRESDEKFYQVKSYLKAITESLPGINTVFTKAYDYMKRKTTVGKNNDPGLKSIADNDELQKEALQIMRKLNIDIEKIDVKESLFNPQILDIRDFKKPLKNVDGKMISLDFISYRKNENGELIAFDFFKDESNGTNLSLGLIGEIIKTLKKGGVLIVDEIDCSLHPLILIPLLKLFKNKEYNTKNAQLIFTLHSTDVLEDDDFRVSEFLFLNNTGLKGTSCVRLTDIENSKAVRNDVNFRKKYLKGFYMGIPYPTL